jgi:hypothetical protein
LLFEAGEMLAEAALRAAAQTDRTSGGYGHGI